MPAERALKSRPEQEEKVVKGKENKWKREGASQFQAQRTFMKSQKRKSEWVGEYQRYKKQILSIP